MCLALVVVIKLSKAMEVVVLIGKAEGDMTPVKRAVDYDPAENSPHREGAVPHAKSN